MSGTDPPYDPPSAAELLAGLRDFFAEEVVAALDEPLRYHVRVAVGVLAQVSRELSLGPGHRKAHAERLRKLGVASDGQLAEAIRRGEMDERFDEVWAVLRADVEDKVQVSNPSALEPGAPPDAAAPA